MLHGVTGWVRRVLLVARGDLVTVHEDRDPRELQRMQYVLEKEMLSRFQASHFLHETLGL